MNMNRMALLATLTLAFQGSAHCGNPLVDALLKHDEHLARTLVKNDPSLVNKPSGPSKEKLANPRYAKSHGVYPINVVISIPMARLLLNHGADINARSYGDMTVLHWLADQDFYDVAAYLITQGADPSLKDDDGNTPFSSASESYLWSLFSRKGKITGQQRYEWVREKKERSRKLLNK